MEWINIEKALPKNEEYVLVYSDDIYILKFHITNDKRKKKQNFYFEDTTGYVDISDVKFWMPLPEMPKE